MHALRLDLLADVAISPGSMFNRDIILSVKRLTLRSIRGLPFKIFLERPLDVDGGDSSKYFCALPDMKG